MNTTSKFASLECQKHFWQVMHETCSQKPCKPKKTSISCHIFLQPNNQGINWPFCSLLQGFWCCLMLEWLQTIPDAISPSLNIFDLLHYADWQNAAMLKQTSLFSKLLMKLLGIYPWPISTKFKGQCSNDKRLRWICSSASARSCISHPWLLFWTASKRCCEVRYCKAVPRG